MRRAVILLALALLTGCGKAPQTGPTAPEQVRAMDVAEPAPAPPDAAQQAPQIAYSYALGYALADGSIAAVQARHVTLCSGLGSARCRVGNTSLTSSDDPAGSTSARATFLIDARLARRFIARLDAVAAEDGGRVAERKVEAEDLTKQLIDTDARVRAKQALADRLLGLIRAANAKVGELVEAERAYAETQEELDAARQLQAALRQRVAMSEVNVDYRSTATSSAWGRVAQSVRAAGATLAASVAALVTFIIAALPWALLLALIVWAMRRRGWGLRWRRRRDSDA